LQLIALSSILCLESDIANRDSKKTSLDYQKKKNKNISRSALSSLPWRYVMVSTVDAHRVVSVEYLMIHNDVVLLQVQNRSIAEMHKRSA